MTNPSQHAIRDASDRMTNTANRVALSTSRRPWLEAVTMLQAAAGDPKWPNYRSLASILDRYKESATYGEEDCGSTFLQLVLFSAASEVMNGTINPGIRIPESIHQLLLQEARRIISEFAALPSPRCYRTDCDLFMKDVALVTGHLLPVGAELIELNAGIPRSVLLRGDFRQFVRGLWHFVGQQRGFHGYCAFHMDDRHLEDFNPEGWRRTYLRIAELLELNPEIRGVFGTAWFYDPAVANVSPHLAYLRTEREAGGAKNFRYGPTPDATDNALVKSRHRAILYQQGKYQPENYFLVWHRWELLQWSQMQRQSGSA